MNKSDNKYVTESLTHLTESNQINNYKKVIIFILFFIITLIIISSIISYPEKIHGKIYLLTNSTPNTIYTPNSGNINLIKKDKSFVKKGEILAYITNNASYYDILLLKKEIGRFDILSPNLSANILTKKRSIGELESYFHNFLIAYNDYQYFINSDVLKLNNKKNDNNISFLEKELIIADISLKTQKSKAITINDVFIDDSIFFNEKIIQKDKYNSSLLNKLDAKLKINSDIYNTTNISKEIQDLKNQKRIFNEEYNIKKDQLSLNLLKHFLELKTAINNWEYNFLIRSPTDGKIEYLQLFITNSQYVSKDTPLFVVLPNYNSILGKGIVSSYGYAKIKEKDSIIIKLNNYPYKEYGVLKGIISNKSDIFNDSIYTLDIGLNNRLITDFNKEIKYSYNMTGEIEYYTEKQSVLQRIIFFLKSIKSI